MANSMVATNSGRNCQTWRTPLGKGVWALANISNDVRKQYQDRVLALNVRGQSGETVLNVTLTLAVTWFPDKQIECNQFCACGGSADPDHVISTDQFSVTLQAPAGISDVHPS